MHECIAAGKRHRRKKVILDLIPNGIALNGDVGQFLFLASFRWRRGKDDGGCELFLESDLDDVSV